MPEFLYLDRDKLWAEFESADTDTLQALEVRYIRSYLASCGSAALGVAATAKTFGAAWPLPVYSGRMAHIAEVKLEMIQLLLTGRYVQLHTFNWRDAVHVSGSLAAGQAIGGVMDFDPSGVEEIVNPDPGGVEVKTEIGKAIPSEMAQIAYLAATNAPPPKTCPRPKRHRFQRLQCAECSTHFDTSYSEWVHCCQCKDRFDVCQKCAKTTKHNPEHQLYTMRGDHPKPQTSVRGVFGVKIKCNACSERLSGEIYTCEDCTGRFDLCLGCYAKGHWCGKHTDPLCRQRL